MTAAAILRLTHALPSFEGHSVDYILDHKQTVEVQVVNNKVWINIDGLCVVRISNAKAVEVRKDTGAE